MIPITWKIIHISSCGKSASTWWLLKVHIMTEILAAPVWSFSTKKSPREKQEKIQNDFFLVSSGMDSWSKVVILPAVILPWFPTSDKVLSALSILRVYLCSATNIWRKWAESGTIWRTSVFSFCTQPEFENNTVAVISCSCCTTTHRPYSLLD